MLRKTRRALLLAGVAALALAGTAQAKQIQQYFYAGEQFEAGGSSPAAIAVDGINHKILVVGNGDKEEGLKISRFNLNGDPAGFPGREESTFFHTGEKLPSTSRPQVAIAVDESGTSSSGNFYISSLREPIYGYAADGTPLPGFPLSTAIGGVCGLTVAPDGDIWVASREFGSYAELSPSGELTGRFLSPEQKGVNIVRGFLGQGGCRIAIDSAGNVYAGNGEHVTKYDSSLHFLGEFAPGSWFGGPNERGTPMLSFDRGDNTMFELFPKAANAVTQADSTGESLVTFGGPDPAHFSYGGLSGSARDLAVDPQTHKVYVLKEGEVNVFSRDASMVTIPNTSADGVKNLSSTGATLTGTLDPDGIATTDCRFEWSPSNEEDGVRYDNVAPCVEGNVFAGGSGPTEVTAAISGLEKGAVYHFRLSSKNANGVTAFSRDAEFPGGDPPTIEASANRITTDSARIAIQLNTEGADSSYHIEIGTDTGYGTSVPAPDARVPARRPGPFLEGIEVIQTPQSLSREVHGLQPETLYHYRVVAENAAGKTEGTDHTFRTFALPGSETNCPNAQARQQTGAAGLLDCRAYELVSALETGGYDVRSGLSSGVSPLATSPQADDAALYSMRSGTIPGIAGHPTNRGADPYLATRGSSGWSTRYVGLASNNPFAAGPFASPLSGSDSALDTFAFGGEEICAPCFEDGSINVPLRLPDGSLVQGMAGSMEPGPAQPAGVVRKPLSADGSHFVFATTAQFEPEGNSNGPDATIYARDLNAKTTEVISTDETGTAIANGDEVAELDVSKDGSRTVIGEKLASDSAGNDYYHLYLHIAGTPESVDLMPGATQGALYDGMTEDGTKVFFTTSEALAAGESDTSADVYRDEVSGPGTTTPQILSQGSGAGDTDLCSPPGTPNNWNAVSGIGKCNALAFAGGAGVASQSGDFYFLSPELLDGSNGTQDQPNLYLVKGGSTQPQFVATIDSSLVKPPPPPPTHPLVTTSFGGPYSILGAMSVDQSNGDVYVDEPGEGRISRFSEAGAADNFTEGPGSGTNQLNVVPPESFAAGLAIDNSATTFNGDIYATSVNSVQIFSPSGKALGELNGSGTSNGFFAEACGVAVDQSNGDVYVADVGGYVWRYAPTAPTLPISDSDYTVTGIETAGAQLSPCAIAADNGNVYAANPVNRYPATSFASTPPSVQGTQIAAIGRGLSTDPVTHEVYVVGGEQITVFNPAGEQQSVIGAHALPSSSRGVAVNATSHHVYASTWITRTVKEFGYQAQPYEPIDNPAILHAAKQAGTYDSADFQITPNGKYAAFSSLLPIDGYASAGHYEVFRYDAAGVGGPQCVSCSPTLATPTSEATLTPSGLSLLEDGRLFFNTGEQLTLRDTNEKQDAYEWEDGRQELISTGTSSNDSELLSVSADGKDAFFFTRQRLVPEDNNGDNVRLYTARENGGFAFGPPQFQCAASDECHGASTAPAPPLAAGTTAGTPGQFAEEKQAKCRKGKVKRRGKCVSRHPHKRHNHKRAAKTTRGGGK